MTQQRFKGQKDTYTRPLTTSRTIPRRPKIRLAELASCSWSPDWERSVLSKARKKKLTAEDGALVALMRWSRRRSLCEISNFLMSDLIYERTAARVRVVVIGSMKVAVFVIVTGLMTVVASGTVTLVVLTVVTVVC